MEEVKDNSILRQAVEARDVELFKAELKKPQEQQETYLELPIEFIEQEIIQNTVFDNPRRWYRNYELKEMLELCGKYIKKKLCAEIKGIKNIFSDKLLEMLNELPLEQIEDVLSSKTNGSSKTEGGIALLYYFRIKVVKNGLKEYPNIWVVVEKINDELLKSLAEKPNDKIWKSVLMQDGMVVPSHNKFNSQGISTMLEDKDGDKRDPRVVTAATPLLTAVTTTDDGEEHDFGGVPEGDGDFPELQLVTTDSDPQEAAQIAALSFDEVLEGIREKFFGAKIPYKAELRARLKNPPMDKSRLYADAHIAFAYLQPIALPEGLAEIDLAAVLEVLNRFFCFNKAEIREILLATFSFTDVSLLCYLRHKNIDLSQYGRVNDVVKEINREYFDGVVALLHEDHGVGASQDSEQIKNRINQALKAGMDPNTQDDNGWTLVHHVIYSFINNKTDADIFAPLNALKKRRANFNIKNKDGNVPLHFAVFYRKESLAFAQALVEVCGAILELVNNRNHTAGISVVVLEEGPNVPAYLRSLESTLHVAIELRDVHQAERYFTSDIENPSTMARRTRGGDLSSFAFIRLLMAPYAKANRFVRWYHNSELQEILELNLNYFQTIFLPRFVNSNNELSQQVIENLPGLLSVLNELSDDDIRSVLTHRREHGIPACALHYIRKHAGAILASYERVNAIAKEIHQQYAHVSQVGNIYHDFMRAINNGVDFLDADFIRAVEILSDAQVNIVMAELHGHEQAPLVVVAKRKKKSGDVLRLESVVGEDAEAREEYLKSLFTYCKTNDIGKLAGLLLKDVEAEGGPEAVTAFIRTKRNGWTALHCAVAEGAKDVVNLLLKKGANVNAIDDSGNGPLHLLNFLRPELGILLKILMNAEGIDLNLKDRQGLTFLDHLVNARGPALYAHIYTLVSTGRVWVTQENMDNACDANTRDALNSPINLLIDAILQSEPEFALAGVKKLIDAGMNVNLMDVHHKSFPIHFAILRGNVEVIALLLAAGADLYSKERPKRSKNKVDNKAKKEGITALYSVVLYQKKEVFQYLLSRITGDDKEALCATVYADINNPKYNHEFYDQVKFLIENGLGVYLFRVAMLNRNYDFVKQLIDLGADVNQQDEGHSALAWALAYGFAEGLLLLLENDATVAEEQKPNVVALLEAITPKSAEQSVDEEGQDEEENSAEEEQNSVIERDVEDDLPALEEVVTAVADPAPDVEEQDNNDQEFEAAARELDEEESVNSGESIESSAEESSSSEEEVFLTVPRSRAEVVANPVVAAKEVVEIFPQIIVVERAQPQWVKDIKEVSANGILSNDSPVKSDPLSRKLVEDADPKNGHNIRPRTATK